MISQPSQTVTYDIRVYPLVLKFLSYHYATSPFGVSSVRYSNPFASFLHGCLDRYDTREEQMPRKYEQLTARLTVGISYWHIKKFGSGKLSAQKVSAFNDFVRQLFFEQLTREVSLHTFLGMGIKTATQQFLDRYGITEDELPIGVALRYYDRIRRKNPLTYCPVLPARDAVILPHERDSAQWEMESGGRQVA